MVSGKNFFSKILQAFKGKTEERPQQEESGHADSHNAMSNSGDGNYVRIIDDGDGVIRWRRCDKRAARSGTRQGA